MEKNKTAAEKLTIEKVDRNMATGTAGQGAVRWYSADDEPLRFSGLYYRRPGEPFRRFPEDRKLPEGVDWLAWNTTGAQLAFKTDSTRIRVRVKLGHECLMDHMTKIGSAGFDLYCGGPGHWFYLAPTRIKVNDAEYDVDIVKDMAPEMREFILNFPLYSGVDSFALALDEKAEVLPPSPWADDRPVVVYGTSITQGGCANHPGMSYTGLLSRKWNLPVLNFGFSGSGKGEAHVLELLAQIRNPRMYILDYEANTIRDGGIKMTLERSIDILRAAYPEVPVLVISSSRRNREILTCHSRIEREKYYADSILFQTELVKNRRAAGDRNLYYLSGAWPGYEEEWDQFTVDGAHATDLGFYVMAKNIGAEVEKILGIRPAAG